MLSQFGGLFEILEKALKGLSNIGGDNWHLHPLCPYLQPTEDNAVHRLYICSNSIPRSTRTQFVAYSQSDS